jgi:hypothetical protein
MNVRRGLWRLWAVLSILWIGYALWTQPTFVSCFYSPGPWCEFWKATDYIDALIVIFWFPIATLLFGVACLWVASGFRTKKS